jgi:hypothetical protein
MSEHLDERIGELLRRDALPERDPAFRISVLERRERKRFLRQSAMLAAFGLVLALIATVGITIGGDAAVAAVALVILAALAIAYMRYEPIVARIIERFRF